MTNMTFFLMIAKRSLKIKKKIIIQKCHMYYVRDILKLKRSIYIEEATRPRDYQAAWQCSFPQFTK